MLEPFVEMNETNCSSCDSKASSAFLDNLIQVPYSDNTTTLKPDINSGQLSSSGTAALAVSSSIGILAFLLLLAGLLSMILKKWRHERLFKKQLRHQTKFHHKRLELACHADATYSNVINLVLQKEDDFAVYANVPSFHRPRTTSPDQVEYAAIVFN